MSDSKEKDLFFANPEESFLKVAKQFQNGLTWLNFFLKYQPAENLQKIKIPVLALNGSYAVSYTHLTLPTKRIV